MSRHPDPVPAAAHILSPGWHRSVGATDDELHDLIQRTAGAAAPAAAPRSFSAA
ncbi:MAG TPA: hypothetical protein PKO41_06730 [Dokdonella sp.]|uniref:hypothetical protein n=1 Tax=Dokdonella sp. TaxID=2291710 RepID=UPI0025C16941|nr:hypothetical protein [Dokdonella sp.]MBX3692513.1 hypothetical protein [Dokdonella sp.]HNR92102.1 hypothetical protein [Dokdonella sp.]